MKITRTSPLFFPFLLFTLFLILSFLQLFELHTKGTGNEIDNLFFYLINILLWLSGAFLTNSLIQTFLWGGLFKRPIEGTFNQLLIDFTSAFIYVLAISGIITTVFHNQLGKFWIIVLAILLIFITALRRRVLSISHGSFFSTDRPFNIGDWIEVIDNSVGQKIIGEVMSISMRNIKIKNEDNSITVVPNSLISNFIIKNFTGTEDEIQFVLSLTLDFSIPTERVKRILFAAAKDALLSLDLECSNEPTVKLKRTYELGVEYNVYYWIKPWENISPVDMNDKINSTILDHLKNSGLTLAYPKVERYSKKIPINQIDLDSSKDRKQILANNEFFNLFNSEELKKLSEKITPSYFKMNETLIQQRASGDSMFILIEGLLDVSMVTENDEKINIGRLTPGEYFGEMSLLTGEARTATVTAITDSVAYEIKKEHLQEIIESRPEIAEDIINTVAIRTSSNLQLIEEAEKAGKNFYQEVLGKIKQFFSLD